MKLGSDEANSIVDSCVLDCIDFVISNHLSDHDGFNVILGSMAQSMHALREQYRDLAEQAHKTDVDEGQLLMLESSYFEINDWGGIAVDGAGVWYEPIMSLLVQSDLDALGPISDRYQSRPYQKAGPKGEYYSCDYLVEDIIAGSAMIYDAVPVLRRAALRIGPQSYGEAKVIQRWILDLMDKAEQAGAVLETEGLVSDSDRCGSDAHITGCCDWGNTSQAVRHSTESVCETWRSVPEGFSLRHNCAVDPYVIEVCAPSGGVYPLQIDYYLTRSSGYDENEASSVTASSLFGAGSDLELAAELAGLDHECIRIGWEDDSLEGNFTAQVTENGFDPAVDKSGMPDV